MFAGVRELLKPGNEANLKGKLGGKRVALEAATFLLDATKAHAHLSARAKQIYDALTNQAALDAQLAHKIAECAVEAVMEFLRATEPAVLYVILEGYCPAKEATYQKQVTAAQHSLENEDYTSLVRTPDVVVQVFAALLPETERKDFVARAEAYARAGLGEAPPRTVVVVQAPAEADGQLAWVSAQTFVDFIVVPSGDSDLCAYPNVKNIVLAPTRMRLAKRGATLQYMGVVINPATDIFCQHCVVKGTAKKTTTVYDFTTWTARRLLGMCIAIGCDYFTLPEVGVTTAYAHFRAAASDDDASLASAAKDAFLARNRGAPWTAELEAKFIGTLNAYLYHPVVHLETGAFSTVSGEPPSDVSTGLETVFPGFFQQRPLLHSRLTPSTPYQHVALSPTLRTPFVASVAAIDDAAADAREATPGILAHEPAKALFGECPAEHTAFPKLDEDLLVAWLKSNHKTGADQQRKHVKAAFARVPEASTAHPWKFCYTSPAQLPDGQPGGGFVRSTFPEQTQIYLFLRRTVSRSQDKTPVEPLVVFEVSVDMTSVTSIVAVQCARTCPLVLSRSCRHVSGLLMAYVTEGHRGGLTSTEYPKYWSGKSAATAAAPMMLADAVVPRARLEETPWYQTSAAAAPWREADHDKRERRRWTYNRRKRTANFDDDEQDSGGGDDGNDGSDSGDDDSGGDDSQMDPDSAALDVNMADAVDGAPAGDTEPGAAVAAKRRKTTASTYPARVVALRAMFQSQLPGTDWPRLLTLEQAPSKTLLYPLHFVPHAIRLAAAATAPPAVVPATPTGPASVESAEDREQVRRAHWREHVHVRGWFCRACVSVLVTYCRDAGSHSLVQTLDA